MGAFTQLVRGMVAAGCTPEQIAIAVEAAETALAPTARQERNRRYYEGRKERLKASETSEIKTIKTISDDQDAIQTIKTDGESPCLPLKQKERSPPTPPSKEKLNSPSNPSSLRSESVDFDKFWAAYPSKNGKKPARAAFVRATGKLSASELTERAAAYGAAKAAAGDEFILHATTWLNQERWNDPLPAPRRTAKSGTLADLATRMGVYDRAADAKPIDPIDPFPDAPNVQFLAPPRDHRQRDRAGGWPDDHQPQTGSRARGTGGS